MGKAAMQRRVRRMRYLARLANEEPERFNKEWEKRLYSWCEQIRKDAGQLEKGKTGKVASVFERVDEAMLVLQHCGEEAYRRYAPEALDLLTTECCRQVARQVDSRLFRFNNYAWMYRTPAKQAERRAFLC